MIKEQDCKRKQRDTRFDREYKKERHNEEKFSTRIPKELIWLSSKRKSSAAKQAHSSVTIFPLWNWGKDEKRIALFPISLLLLVTLIHSATLLISISPDNFSWHCLNATNSLEHHCRPAKWRLEHKERPGQRQIRMWITLKNLCT